MLLQFWRKKKLKTFNINNTDIPIISRLVDQEDLRLYTSNPRRMQRLPKKQWVTKKLTEDVFESIFLLRKEHILPLLEFIWAGLLTEKREVEVEIVIVEVMAIVMVEEEDVIEEVVEEAAVMDADDPLGAAVVMDADDPLLHTIEAAVEGEGIIVQDPDLIHLVDIERSQTGDVVEI